MTGLHASLLAKVVIVIRHGESEANSQEIISDKTVDHPLTELGIAQAQETAKRLKNEKFDLIVSSSRQRAQITAQVINEFHHAKMIITDDLIERDYGIFSGMKKSKARELMLEDSFGWMDIPKSETTSEIDRRVGHVVAMFSVKYPGSKILVSTHEDIVRSFYRVLGKKSVAASMAFKIDNSQPRCFIPTAKSVRVSSGS